MINEMDFTFFENQFDKLCKRFRHTGKAVSEQCQSYFELLSHLKNRSILAQAFTSVMKTEVYFPTPDKIEQTYFAIQPAQNQQAKKWSDCNHCKGSSWLMYYYTKEPEYTFTLPCAYCNKESRYPLIVAMEDKRIFNAYQKGLKNGRIVFLPDLHNTMEREGAMFIEKGGQFVEIEEAVF